MRLWGWSLHWGREEGMLSMLFLSWSSAKGQCKPLDLNTVAKLKSGWSWWMLFGLSLLRGMVVYVFLFVWRRTRFLSVWFDTSSDLRIETKFIWVTPRSTCAVAHSLPSQINYPDPLGRSPEVQSTLESATAGRKRRLQEPLPRSINAKSHVPHPAHCWTGWAMGWGTCKLSLPCRGSAASQPWIHPILAVKFYLLHDCTGRLLSANLVMFKPASGMRSQEIWLEEAERLLLRSQVSPSWGAERAVTLMQDAICFFLL